MTNIPWRRLLLPVLGVVTVFAAQLSASRVATLPRGLYANSAGQTTIAREAIARRQFLVTHCKACHNATLRTAGLSLESIDTDHVGKQAEIWEKVLRKIRSGQMPPSGRPRPDKDAATQFADQLAAALDELSAAAPDPGRPTVHRLNRGEYVN